jgi:hypothetical protein
LIGSPSAFSVDPGNPIDPFDRRIPIEPHQERHAVIAIR